MAAIPLAIAGAGGRMGRMLVALAAQHPDLELRGAFEVDGHAVIGEDAGAVAGIGPLGITVTSDAAAAISQAQVLIEFTLPDPSLEHLALAADSGCAVVLGTTGFTPDQQAVIDDLAARIPLLQASNMSVGVTVLTEVVEDVSRVAETNLSDRILWLAGKNTVRTFLKRELRQYLDDEHGAAGIHARCQSHGSFVKS